MPRNQNVRVSDQITGFPYANPGTKVVARSKISPLSDQISDQIPVPPISGFVIWFTLHNKLSNPRKKSRFLTKFSSVARDSTKLRRSSGNARNVPRKSRMCAFFVMHICHTCIEDTTCSCTALCTSNVLL